MMGTPGQPADQNAGGMAGMMATMMGGRVNPPNANPQGAEGGMMKEGTMAGMMRSAPMAGTMGSGAMAGMMGSAPMAGAMGGGAMASGGGTGGGAMGGGSATGGMMRGYGGMMQQMMRGGGMTSGGGKGMTGGMAGMMGIGGGTPAAHPVHTTKIRPRFDCLVEKIYVGRGQQVKKGDPLADLFSIELARAKNDYLSARVQKENDQRNMDVRRKLVETGAISTQTWLRYSECMQAKATSRTRPPETTCCFSV